ncbi:MAG: class I SAM-dependent methyltransferase [Pirellulaceae bacterium]|nr:class I SAM-dependent methyltransferase [Pirellulaceae bacterium]
MDKNRFSSIAHGDLPVWNPISVGHLQQYVSQLRLPNAINVLDIGCGRGHLLELIHSQYQVRAVGIDSSPYAIAGAAREMAELVGAGRLTLVERAFDACDYGEESFELIVCIGSTHAAGGYLNTLKMAKRLLAAKGLLLVGEGYWKCTPAAEYLAFLRMSSEDQTTHQGNKMAAVNEGFDLVSCTECSQEEWDAYEDQYARNVEDFVIANPLDDDAQAMLRRIRRWREAYLRWGRDTLGFGLYLFRNRSD